MAIGVLGCMIVLSAEAGIIAQWLGTSNLAAMRAGVAMLFLIELPYDFFLNGMQFIYISEIWPMHLRAKGMSLGVAMISFMNIVWLQSAPTAMANIGWKYYLGKCIGYCQTKSLANDACSVHHTWHDRSSHHVVLLSGHTWQAFRGDGSTIR